jgi:hypothetical protein
MSQLVHAEKGDQTPDHLIYTCERLTKKRSNLKKTAIRTNKWPINERDLIRRHYNEMWIRKTN